MDASVEQIEEAAYAAWPAVEVQRDGGWRLRFTHGVTQRGNSVWTGQGTSDRPLEARIEAAEAFYAERERPCLFALSPAGHPADLDHVLEARGYARHSPVDVQVAESREVVARCGPPSARVLVETEPSPAWLELATTRGRYTGASAAVFEALLARLGGRGVFALAEGEDGPAATGLAVLDPPWCGVFAMRTLDAQRGQGLGRAALAGLAHAARERGADHLYLQVEQDNPAALALYRGAGFTRRYVYHYRQR